MDNKSNLTEEINENYRIAAKVYKGLIHKKNFYLEDDLIQEAVLHIIEKRDEYDPIKSKYSTWASTLAENRMKNLLEENKHHLKTVSVFENLTDDLQRVETLAIEQDTPFEIMKRGKLFNEIKSLLACISPRNRGIVIMSINGFKQREIAAKFGVSQSNVSGIVNEFRRSAQHLRGFLK